MTRMPERHEISQALEEAKVILASACLLGVECRFDGTHKRLSKIHRTLSGTAVVPLCPEVAGGLGIPRAPAEIAAGSGDDVLDGRSYVLTASGRDVTKAYLHGAALATEAAIRFGATLALLKERSPSCGVHALRRGAAVVPGTGVAAAALSRAGVIVVSEEELLDPPRDEGPKPS